MPLGYFQLFLLLFTRYTVWTAETVRQPLFAVRFPVSLWAYFSECLSMLSFSFFCSLFSSLSDTIKQKHISKPSERGIFLSHSLFSFQPAPILLASLFTACLYSFSVFLCVLTCCCIFEALCKKQKCSQFYPIPDSSS